ncbi:hypothetical protein N0V93_000025 [Gnomoniopsis smithogilvyi]|uniref:Uncharacterized protein n=1 Tax=Gnomoniopsis smithogilvyi TaxID=1191159 RepID=A0A9W9D1C4_9PEZI|nr:hypothetical protein N0V93_000025 [Gnomoniopsis smithogilvyi]
MLGQNGMHLTATSQNDNRFLGNPLVTLGCMPMITHLPVTDIWMLATTPSALNPTQPAMSRKGPRHMQKCTSTPSPYSRLISKSYTQVSQIGSRQVKP